MNGPDASSGEDERGDERGGGQDEFALKAFQEVATGDMVGAGGGEAVCGDPERAGEELYVNPAGAVQDVVLPLFVLRWQLPLVPGAIVDPKP